MNATFFFLSFLFLSCDSFQSRPGRLRLTYRVENDASLVRGADASLTAQSKKDPIGNDTSNASPWDKVYDLLLLYRDREGNCKVPQKHKEDGSNLGIWLNNQQRLAKEDKLISDRRRSLEEAGVVWDMNSWRWNQMYDLLLRYKAREGHCDVPHHHQEEGVKLGFWLANQRRATINLDENRKELLQAAGVSLDPLRESSRYRYSLLLDFKEREGHCDVPLTHQQEGVNLGTWLFESAAVVEAWKT